MSLLAKPTELVYRQQNNTHQVNRVCMFDQIELLLRKREIKKAERLIAKALRNQPGAQKCASTDVSRTRAPVQWTARGRII